MNKNDVIIPLIFSDKFREEGIYSPFSFSPDDRVEGEVFEIVNDNAAPNVIPGRYMVSNYGRIWDCFDKKYMPISYNKPYNEDGSNDGYLKTKLVCYESFYKTYSRDRYFHRVVLSTFEPEHDSFRNEVNHKDGNKENNNITNLEWVTSEENIKHAIDNNLLEKGFLPNISNEQVISICEKLSEGVPSAIIAEELSVPKYTVTSIKHRKIFNNISKDYVFKETDIEKYGNKYCNSRSTELIEEICKKIVANESVTKISKEYNIPRKTVYGIINREEYTDISSKYDFSNFNNKKITPEDVVHKICKYLQMGYSTADIARILNVGVSLVTRIRNKRQYSDISSQYTFPEPRKMNNKLPEESIRKVCKLLQNGESMINVSIHTGVKYHIVQNIYMKRSYTNISKDYNF